MLYFVVFLSERRDAEAQSYFRTQISQIKGIFSLTLVIDIPKILNICGCIFISATLRLKIYGGTYALVSCEELREDLKGFVGK